MCTFSTNFNFDHSFEHDAQVCSGSAYNMKLPQSYGLSYEVCLNPVRWGIHIVLEPYLQDLVKNSGVSVRFPEFITIIYSWIENWTPDLNSLDNFGVAKCFLPPILDSKCHFWLERKVRTKVIILLIFCSQSSPMPHLPYEKASMPTLIMWFEVPRYLGFILDPNLTKVTSDPITPGEPVVHGDFKPGSASSVAATQP